MKISHEILPPEKIEGRGNRVPPCVKSANEGTNQAQQGQPGKARTRIQTARPSKAQTKATHGVPGTLILFIKQTEKPYCTQVSRRANCALIRQPELHGIGIHRRILVQNGRIRSF
jgi:hypothetical protein